MTWSPDKAGAVVCAFALGRAAASRVTAAMIFEERINSFLE